ncbi:unnamed protein product [Rotaria magnacalcarata]|uniref:Peptide hydrolase n=3 Tax=Rotaria magnacalcarata TaxID=392030 RepID=A0A816XV59_9BILA|nr:unnamed protein product [Rotaria magnacalcarata]CAF1666272.1 unnamed protein product [Rotaria magnacalcarata]CAF2103351.1 unnamed protein product [Rotaria magnacalcarata]CAF2112972.1 unnamed protein product [Rotaria magnacalcarata]CAF2151253.1 unnamed protein product [Rotaria magnacalcarata]
MNDGIVLQSQLRPMPNDDSAAIPTHSALSISSLATKKQNYLYKYVLFGLVFLFLLVIIILVAIIVSKISSYSAMPIPIASTMTRTNEPLIKKELSSLVDSITLEDMLIHLRQFESRAIGTVSFNRTIDYLTSQLNKENYFNVQKYYFSVPRVKLDANPILMSLPNISNASLFTFPKDFVPMDRSTEARNWSLTDGRPLSVVARLGCYIEDWNTTKEGDVALVQRGNCTFVHKILLATQKRVSAFLVYNDGLTLERLEPLNNTRAPKNNTLPTLFLSYEAGMRLILENISRIYMRVEFQSLPPAIVTNVCADTKQGNANRTIVVGSHSDSVSAGPGLNDNGSGMAATLAMALHLAHLLAHTNYATKMNSRIKFCWWGGEESGLLGSQDFVKQAKTDGSLGSYSVNLNFDMLASPNFIFGIYDGKTANNQTTPPRAIPGSNRITRLFVDYFEQNRLPWDYTDFSGRSDYGPFLAEGIACGGLFAGADDIKNQEQRDRYLKMLGSTLGGMANTDLDPCYHRKCDTLENLNTFAYLHMTKAAAYVLDFLAQLQDLNHWLYP